MAFIGNYDASDVDPTDQFEPLPAGEYAVVVTESDMKPTKNGKGEYLQLTLEVIDGPMKGRKVWDRLNLKNPNTTAMEIAQRQLSQIQHATGVMPIKDSSQLHNIPVIAEVKYRQAADGYNATNEIKRYKKRAGTAARAPQAAPAQTQAPAAAAQNHAAPPSGGNTQPAPANAPPWAVGQ